MKTFVFTPTHVNSPWGHFRRKYKATFPVTPTPALPRTRLSPGHPDASPTPRRVAGRAPCRQHAGRRTADAAVLLLGEKRHRMGQRAWSCSARRLPAYRCTTRWRRTALPREPCRRRTRPRLGDTHAQAIREGSATPQARSGGGPGAGCLSDTRQGARGWP